MIFERLTVTGGRKFTGPIAEQQIEADLRVLRSRGLQRVAEGFCPLGGADHLTHFAWRYLCDESTVRYPVDFTLDGPGHGAFNRRNIRMLETERPNLVSAYPDPDSRGTWHCVREALRFGIPVLVWTGALPGSRRAFEEAARVSRYLAAVDEPRVALIAVDGYSDVERYRMPPQALLQQMLNAVAERRAA